MEDRVLNAIGSGEINTENISFQKIISFRRQITGIHDQLGYGRNILTSYQQLDQYLHSYGNMISGQWDVFLDKALFHDDRSIDSVCIVSYGCGQALELSILFDQIKMGDLQTGLRLRNITKQIVLIEPSEVALARAYGVVNTYCPDSKIVAVQKCIDDVDASELSLLSTDTNIHIFSNILDIPAFDAGLLFSKMFETCGRHIILAVSHDRPFEGGSERFYSLEKAVTADKHNDWLRVQRSCIEQFTISNKRPAISWELMLEVCT